MGNTAHITAFRWYVAIPECYSHGCNIGNSLPVPSYLEKGEANPFLARSAARRIRPVYRGFQARRRRRELPTTITDELAIAAAAMPGTMKPATARGMATML